MPVADAAGVQAPDGNRPESAEAMGSPKCTAMSTTLLDAKGFFLGEDAGRWLAAGADFPAANETDLYYEVDFSGSPWASGYPTRVQRLPLDGGAPSEIARSSGFIAGLVLTPTSVVFSESFVTEGNGDILSVPLQGGPTHFIAGTGKQPGWLTSDGQDLYFTDFDGVHAVSLAGGNVRTLTGQTGSIALAGSSVIIADATSGTVFSIPKGGGSLTTLATGQDGAQVPLACGDAVCWFNAMAGDTIDNPISVLMRLSPGGPPTALTPTAPLSALPVIDRRALFDGDAFYAVGGKISGTSMIPAAGGTVLGVAGGSVAVDDHCAYFVSDLGILSQEKSSLLAQLASAQVPQDAGGQ